MFFDKDSPEWDFVAVEHALADVESHPRFLNDVQDLLENGLMTFAILRPDDDVSRAFLYL